MTQIYTTNWNVRKKHIRSSNSNKTAHCGRYIQWVSGMKDNWTRRSNKWNFYLSLSLTWSYNSMPTACVWLSSTPRQRRNFFYSFLNALRFR
jgi:hypothetical protein